MPCCAMPTGTNTKGISPWGHFCVLLTCVPQGTLPMPRDAYFVLNANMEHRQRLLARNVYVTDVLGVHMHIYI